MFIFPVFAQNLLGFTATQTGLILLPGSLATGRGGKAGVDALRFFQAAPKGALEGALQEIPAMATDYKVRGCCCGVPFGCGVLVLAAGMVALWKLALPRLATLLGFL